jgi:hypothetical protein
MQRTPYLHLAQKPTLHQTVEAEQVSALLTTKVLVARQPWWSFSSFEVVRRTGGDAEDTIPAPGSKTDTASEATAETMEPPAEVKLRSNPGPAPVLRLNTFRVVATGAFFSAVRFGAGS